KTVLLDQWIDRTETFTDAEIGYIRQDKIITKNKNVVIGMIQSISMKDYDPKIFDQFSFVIFDECHHAASKVYSNALYKTGAQYVLGLSATPDRTDGTSYVLNWYLGDMIHREPVKKNKQVIVKIFNYNSNHSKFREHYMRRSGKITPAISKMINELSDIRERTIHIANIISELRKNPERKILILSGRISLLEELKKLVDDNIASDIKNGDIIPEECITYFYTGSVKPNDRHEAEQQADILFASYSIADEGLDIERLNTVILATPRKNIIQAS